MTTSYHYDAAGAQAYEHNDHAGITKQVGYDALGRPDELNHFKDANADGIQTTGEHTIAKFSYTYDAAGNRTSSIETFDHDADGTADQTQKFTWAYDGLNRLRVETFDNGNNQTADAEDYVTRYTFDLASNRELMVKDTGNYDNAAGSFTADETTAYTYDDNDRLQTETVTDGSSTVTKYTEYAYNGTTQTEKAEYTDDTKATLTRKTVNTYDVMGRLEKVEIDTNGDDSFNDTLIYTYDAGGLRVATDHNGTTTLHLFDKQNMTGYAQVLEEGVDDNADGKLDAAEIDKTFMLGHDVLAQVVAGELLTFLYDLHGSTRALTDALGQIKNDTISGGGIQAFTYDAYGNLIATGFGVAAQANALTSLLYSGEFTNAVTGQQYLRARFYDPSSGRFNRLDPFAGNTSDPLSLHKYAYVHGNPVMGIDPTGLFSLTEVLTSVGKIGAKVGARLRAARNVSIAAYRAIVNAVVMINLAVAFTESADSITEMVNFSKAAPYQLKRLARFNRFGKSQLTCSVETLAFSHHALRVNLLHHLITDPDSRSANRTHDEI